MSETEVLTPEVGPEAIATIDTEQANQTDEGEAENLDEQPSPEGDEAEQKQRLSRHQRDKQYKAFLRETADKATRAAQSAQAELESLKAAMAANPPPKEADFDDPMDYFAAKAGYEAAQRYDQRAISTVQARATQAAQAVDVIAAQEAAAIESEWQGKAQEAAGRYSDFATVVAAPGLFPEKSALVDLVKRSEVAGDLAYHLATNRALHDSIVAMPPLEAARAIGRIEATLDKPKPRTQSNAPAPISPVKGGAVGAKDPAKMTFADFKAAREKGWAP